VLNFSFSDEQELLRSQIRKFAVKDLRPMYGHWDKTKAFPYVQLKKMSEMGLSGLRIEEKYGGNRQPYVNAGIVAEEIARADFNCAYFVLVSSLIGDLLTQFAHKSLKEYWLPLMATGEKLIAFALTEPSCGSDSAALITKAKRQGDFYVLNGEKSSISLVQAADAVLVFARLDNIPGYDGIRGFFVPCDEKGVSKTLYNSMGSKGLGRGSLFLEDVRIPLKNCISKDKTAFKMVMIGFDYSRAIIGLMCLATAEVSLEETIKYARERTSFGKRLSMYQGISFPIAEYYTYLEAAKLLCYKTLWLRDENLEHTKEAAMCKWWPPKLSADIIHECLLVHGHYGYTDEYPFEQRLRDVIGLEIGDGTAQIQKLIIARKLIGEECKP
jgi:cyclohexanecarboxyl-CoA dehydrogenase